MAKRSKQVEQDQAEAVEPAEAVATLPVETPAQTLDVLTPHELAERLRTTGTGETKLAIVTQAETIEDAIAALEKSGHKVTAAKARTIIG